ETYLLPITFPKFLSTCPRSLSLSLSFTHLLPLSQSLAVCVRSSPCAFCVCLVFVFLSFRSLSLLADLSVLSIHFYRLSLFSSLFSFGRSLSRHLSLSLSLSLS